MQSKITIRHRKIQGDEFVIKEVFEQDEYSLNNLNLGKNPVIVDIGAHIGCFSIKAAKTYPNSKILAFEPMKANYNLFKKNIKLNKLKNICASKKGVASTKGKRKLYIDKKNTAAHSISIKSEKYQIIKCITLSDVFKKHRLVKIDLLKIDAEGAEYEILYSTHKKYLDKIDKILMEYHDDFKNPELNGKALENFLNKKGFKTISLKETIPKRGLFYFSK